MKRVVAFVLSLIMVLNGACCCHTNSQSKNPEKTTISLSKAKKKHIWIDSTFSKEEKEDIITAYKTVECSTAFSLVVFEFTTNAGFGDYYLMDPKSSILVVNATSDDPRIKDSDSNLAKKNKHTVGLYLSQEAIPTVLLPRDRLNRKIFYQIAVHEAIHSSLNILSHSESREAVMFYACDETSAKDITKKDLEFICDTQQCDASLMRICKGK